MNAPFDPRRHRLLVCLGPGGVGKTTLSAAFAVHAAAHAAVVDVMTVDPAPRLLDLFGLDGGIPGPHTVALDGIPGLEKSGVHTPRLRAHRLDPKHTFDALVRRHAPSPAACGAILENRIYHNLSSALSGVADYMAMEKLLELHSDPGSGFIVLDTPPAGEALDFLAAPQRLLRLLNSRALALLGAPRRLMGGGLKLADAAARAALSAFDRVTGLHLLRDVREFVAGFDGMYAGFAERAERAQALLRAPETVIVVVTTPESERARQAIEFVDALKRAALQTGAIVVNRTTPGAPDAAELARAGLPAALKRKAARNAGDFAALRRRETRALAELAAGIAPEVRILSTPDLGREPGSLADLAEIGRGLEVLRP
jgi:anion-transporting  ArsA/GET3 family ATPase